MNFLKDIECTVNTPVVKGGKDISIYGQGEVIRPAVPGRTETNNDKKVFLDQLLPLEEYDRIIVFFSGGKDSVAAYLKLRELGVPAEKLELWHHDIDGQHPTRRMDWYPTHSYVKAFGEALGSKVKYSWREKGFFGEVYREGSSQPVVFEVGDELKTVYPKAWARAQELKEAINQAEINDDMEALEAARAELHSLGKRLKFPAKAASLGTRWCSAYLKIMVGDTVITNLEETKTDAKILLISGERRGESTNRAKYNEMEYHRTNATARNKRLVHHWRPVIDYSERDVWEVLKRWKVNPHPCYRAGWNRCSCAACIFSSPAHFKGFKEIYPDRFQELRQDELTLGFTLDNKKNLDQYIENATSCLDRSDAAAIDQLVSGSFTASEIFVDAWNFPAGAFHGSEGGPC
jgi:3'-phosphoadenosine 5'-phosphosulfate sulfotransferase (PAPS reductase)/FAD synthetase